MPLSDDPQFEIKPSPCLDRRHVIARALLTIDCGAISDNWRALNALSADSVETAAVVKADAYGLGIAEVATALAAAGVRSFFVAMAHEGVKLRSVIGPEAAIYVLSGLMAGDEEICRKENLISCLNSIEQISRFADVMAGLRCAIQLDSGMNRLGLEPDDFAKVAPLVARLAPTLLLSHLACADTPAHIMNARQRSVFVEETARIPGAKRSLVATGGILLGEDYHFAMTRPGIGLYGGLSFASARPVVSLALPVIQIRDVAVGETVGYDNSWVAARPSRIATVAAGYADGLMRAIGQGGIGLHVGAQCYPLVGRVSMDLITVDVTDASEVPTHMEILNAHQTIDDLATAAGTIGYEVLTSLGGRYDRVYKEAAQPPDPA